tara:strand:+ start:5486 stop:6352 length:867 start_codon:yes stop_codon:yes gene_type:complete
MKESDHLKADSWIDEYQSGQRFGLQGKVLINKESKIQKITVVKTEKYGNGLLIDNCWMTTEYDEKYYHECLVQPAMCSAKSIDKVLIIGGGDGGSARECLRHINVKHLDLVEIDSEVVKLSQKYLPCLGGKAWIDPRLNLKCEDGIEWIKQAKSNSYDVIIIDGSDPKGPAEGLFNKSFYTDCKRILKHDGVFAAQTESPAAFRQLHIDIVKTIRSVFKYADPLYGCVPIYPSGYWSWTFGAKDKRRYLRPINRRVNNLPKDFEIWSPKWQNGAFNAIPNCIEQALKE